MNPEIVQLAELDAAVSYVYSQVEERPYGLLAYNTANPDHHSANVARRIRAEDPEAAIADIVAFYRSHGLKPRVRVNQLTVPTDLVARLQAHGFTTSSSATQVMHWAGPAAQPRPDPSVTVRRAGVADVATLARIGAEDEPSAQHGWHGRKVQAQISHPAVRSYLASLDGKPAGCAYVFQSLAVGLIEDVATLSASRGRGVATALIAVIQAEASTPLLLEVEAANAARIYARAGFRDCGKNHETNCWLEA
jgi:predicted GNAT family acetyltransferase